MRKQKQSIVLDLQHATLDNDVALTDLLDKADFVAHKLQMQRFIEWIEKERDGYRYNNYISYLCMHSDLAVSKLRLQPGLSPEEKDWLKENDNATIYRCIAWLDHEENPTKVGLEYYLENEEKFNSVYIESINGLKELLIKKFCDQNDKNLEEEIRYKIAFYHRNKHIPNYRKTSAIIELTKFNGEKGFYGQENQKIKQLLNSYFITHSIIEIEDQIAQAQCVNETLLVADVPEYIKSKLLSDPFIEKTYKKYNFCVQISSFKNIVHSVKKIIRNWAIELEQENIMGYDMTFTQNEKNRGHEFCQAIGVVWKNRQIWPIYSNITRHTYVCLRLKFYNM